VCVCGGGGGHFIRGRTSPREIVMELCMFLGATKMYFKVMDFSTSLYIGVLYLVWMVGVGNISKKKYQ